MRRLRYNVATSLDGYIAASDGSYDWIIMDPAIDFKALFEQFDTVVMGRKTFEISVGQGGGGAMPGMKVIVFSRTLRPSDYPSVTITDRDPAETVRELKEKPGKDIWLFGGGVLFRTLVDAKLVDTIELGIIPALLGDGIPLLPAGSRVTGLRLTEAKNLPSGIIMATYELAGGSKAKSLKRTSPTRSTKARAKSK